MRFFMTLLPTFQYGVGTDYFSYQNIYNNANELDTFYQNKGISLLWIYEAISTDWMGFKGFIALTVLLQSLLVVCYCFSVMENYGYSLLFWFFFLFVVLIYFIPR